MKEGCYGVSWYVRKHGSHADDEQLFPTYGWGPLGGAWV